MKSSPLFWIVPVIFFTSCNNHEEQVASLQKRVDSLEYKLSHTYKPGLGDFMSAIQVHHAKLWFAGINENWKLAGFEINEIRESLNDIDQYCTDRPEIRSLGTIIPPLDSVDTAIRKKNLSGFKTGYISLTQTCNNCHQANSHGFNVIRTPNLPPIDNQDFKNVQ
jgi:hypothetical protein